MKKLNSKVDNGTRQHAMPSTTGKGKLFRIKHITLLEGETFLRNKHEIVFFEVKCTFFGRKENTIKYSLDGSVVALLPAF